MNGFKVHALSEEAPCFRFGNYGLVLHNFQPKGSKPNIRIRPTMPIRAQNDQIRFNALQGSIFSQLLTNKLQHSAEPTC